MSASAGAFGSVPLLALLRRRWWLLLLALVPMLALTAVRTADVPPVYEARSTFVVRPVDADAERVMRAMDTLLRGVEINTTYASIVGSRLVHDRALEGLELSDAERGSLSASGKVITGTSILEIRTEGSSPEVAHAYAEAVADATLTYINELQNGFGLVPLDAPNLPRSPAGTGRALSFVVSGLLGALLGIGLVVASGLIVPIGRRRGFDIVDPVTGASTEAFFLQRLKEEVARIDRNGGGLTVALLVPSGGPKEILPGLLSGPHPARTAALLRGELREGDVVAHLGRGRFAVLALDRIAPELEGQIRSAHPNLALRVSELTYVGSRKDREGDVEDLPTLLQRLEEGLIVASKPQEAAGARGQPDVAVWSGRS